MAHFVSANQSIFMLLLLVHFHEHIKRLMREATTIMSSSYHEANEDVHLYREPPPDYQECSSYLSALRISGSHPFGIVAANAVRCRNAEFPVRHYLSVDEILPNGMRRRAIPYMEVPFADTAARGPGFVVYQTSEGAKLLILSRLLTMQGGSILVRVFRPDGQQAAEDVDFLRTRRPDILTRGPDHFHQFYSDESLGNSRGLDVTIIEAGDWRPPSQEAMLAVLQSTGSRRAL